MRRVKACMVENAVRWILARPVAHIEIASAIFNAKFTLPTCLSNTASIVFCFRSNTRKNPGGRCNGKLHPCSETLRPGIVALGSAFVGYRTFSDSHPHACRRTLPPYQEHHRGLPGELELRLFIRIVPGSERTVRSFEYFAHTARSSNWRSVQLT